MWKRFASLLLFFRPKCRSSPRNATAAHTRLRGERKRLNIYIPKLQMEQQVRDSDAGFFSHSGQQKQIEGVLGKFQMCTKAKYCIKIKTCNGNEV